MAIVAFLLSSSNLQLYAPCKMLITHFLSILLRIFAMCLYHHFALMSIHKMIVCISSFFATIKFQMHTKACIKKQLVFFIEFLPFVITRLWKNFGESICGLVSNLKKKNEVTKSLNANKRLAASFVSEIILIPFAILTKRFRSFMHLIIRKTSQNENDIIDGNGVSIYTTITQWLELVRSKKIQIDFIGKDKVQNNKLWKKWEYLLNCQLLMNNTQNNLLEIISCMRDNATW